MSLELQVEGGENLSVVRLAAVRALGLPVIWRFLTSVTAHTRGGQEAGALANLLLKGPVKVRPLLTGGTSATLGAESLLVGLRWKRKRDVDCLEIEAHGTFTSKTPDPFLPRRRVHRVSNMLQLIERFSNIARPLQRLMAELENLRFPEKTSIIQDGVSDWEFLAHILDHCIFLKYKDLLDGPGPKWLPLVLVGGADPQAGTEGRWLITPSSRAAYEQWGMIAARQISYSESDSWEQPEFATQFASIGVPDFPTCALPYVVLRHPRRTFDTATWLEWLSGDLPRFTASKALVTRIEDRLYQVGQDAVGWDTRVFASPPQSKIVGPTPRSRLMPWLGLANVETTSINGPWITARLPGFETKEDLVDVRLSTPFSGHDGRKGLHFVPSKDTEVAITWNGRFDSSVVLMGNARSQETVFPAPSVYFESTYSGQYEDVDVKRVGPIRVESDFVMGIDQQTRVRSARSLNVNADGADLNMNSGIVYTGRGM